MARRAVQSRLLFSTAANDDDDANTSASLTERAEMVNTKEPVTDAFHRLPQTTKKRDLKKTPATRTDVTSQEARTQSHQLIHSDGINNRKDPSQRTMSRGTCRQQRSPTPLPTSHAGTASLPNGSIVAAGGSSAADAVAFQYYSHQRQLHAKRHASSADKCGHVSVDLQRRPRSASDAPGSTPAAVLSVDDSVVTSYSPPEVQRTRPPATRTRYQRRVHPRSNRPITAPSLRGANHEGSAREASSPSSIPSTPPRGRSPDEMRSSLSSGRPKALSPVRQRRCEGLVRVLAQLPSAQAQEVLITAARQCEARRLLHHYGGIHALPAGAAERRAGKSPDPSTSSLTSSSVLERDADGRHRDGRSILLAVLKFRIQAMGKTERPSHGSPSIFPSGTPRPALCSDGQQRGHSHGTVASGAPLPSWSRQLPPTHPQRGSRGVAGSAPPSTTGGRSRIGSARGRAPHRLRSRVKASREAESRACTTDDIGTGAGSPFQPMHDPSQVPLAQEGAARGSVFMQTIRPAQRHAAFNRAAWNETLVPSAETRQQRDIHTEALSAPADDRCPRRTAGDDALGDPTETSLTSSAPARTPAVQKKRSGVPPPLPHLTDVVDAEMSTSSIWSIPKGTVLSPGAAAARRAYLEKQQRSQEELSSSPQERYDGSRTPSDYSQRSSGTRNDRNETHRYERKAPSDRYELMPIQPSAPMHEMMDSPFTEQPDTVGIPGRDHPLTSSSNSRASSKSHIHHEKEVIIATREVFYQRADVVISTEKTAARTRGSPDAASSVVQDSSVVVSSIREDVSLERTISEGSCDETAAPRSPFGQSRDGSLGPRAARAEDVTAVGSTPSTNYPTLREGDVRSPKDASEWVDVSASAITAAPAPATSDGEFRLPWEL